MSLFCRLICNPLNNNTLYIYEGYSGLTSVTIPENVKFIENGSFQNCSALTSVIIPNNVTTIEYYRRTRIFPWLSAAMTYGSRSSQRGSQSYIARMRIQEKSI